MPKEREQRWRERQERWVAPADRPLFDPAGFEVRPVAEGPAREFVEAHHYSGSYVASRVPAPEGVPYFAETTRREDRSPRTGRRYKTPRRVSVPGADPGVVGFIDYEILEAEGGGVVPQIHYMAVRSDQRGRGVMRKLVAAFYERFATASWIDWGDIHHDAVAKLFRERRDAGAHGEGPRTHGKVR